MTDLRQGVTETQHAVLDLIEERAVMWADLGDFDDRLNRAKDYTFMANNRPAKLKARRLAALTAAAMLIDAAEEIGSLIGNGEAA